MFQFIDMTAGQIIFLLATAFLVLLQIRNVMVYRWRMQWINDCKPFLQTSFYYPALRHLWTTSYLKMLLDLRIWSYKSAFRGMTPGVLVGYLTVDRENRKAKELPELNFSLD